MQTKVQPYHNAQLDNSQMTLETVWVAILVVVHVSQELTNVTDVHQNTSSMAQPAKNVY
jgi:hypothetical protein